MSKKFISLLTSTALFIGLLFGLNPTVTFAKTTKVQAQNNLKKQVSSYTKSLNNLKKEIKQNDTYIATEYNILQSNIKAYIKYNYTGLDQLKSDSSKYKSRLDKLRKDNISVDMKKIATGFNSYIKKVNSTGAKSFYLSQRAKLVSILMKQEDLLYEMMDTNEMTQFQIEEENEIYIYNALPIEHENLNLESTKFYSKMIEVMQKEEEIITYSYKVLNVTYTIKKQIERDLEDISNENYIDDESLSDGEIIDDMNLNEHIRNRDIEKSRIAMQHLTKVLQVMAKNTELSIVEMDKYKQNLTTLFPNNVKAK